MMRRIAILTFVRERNAGAALQAYALQRFMMSLAPSDVIIHQLNYSFNPLFVEKNKLIRVYKAIRKIRNLKGMICNPCYYRECKLFVYSNIILSEDKYTRANIKNSNSIYDAFVVGSDQVWNGRMTDDSFGDFLLEFCKKKKYSYAASCAKAEIFENYADKILKSLKTYCGISLRESINLNEIASHTGKTPLVHIDPTLLLDEIDYLKFIENSLIPKGKFIFVYTVAHHDKLFDFVRQLQRVTGCLVVYSNPYKDRGLDDLNGSIFIKALHPKQLVSLVAKAEYVCTTSFHGTAFSILFKKRFFAEINCADGINSRINSLLETFELQDRAIENFKGDIIATPDYANANMKLSKKREESKLYLNSIIYD